MFEREMKVFEFSQILAVRMGEDVPDERLADQPQPQMNHAAWLFAWPRRGRRG